MCLDHLHSSLPDFGDGSWDVHHLLFLYLLQDIVNGNECTCSTYTSTGCIYKAYACNNYTIEFILMMYLTCSALP